MFASASSVATFLLIGTSRYYLPWVPLFYVGVAYSIDSLLLALSLVRYKVPLVALAVIVLCSPNYLTPRPNSEMDAIRRAAASVKEQPVIAANWADPYVVLGLCEKAKALNLWDGIRSSDIEAGKIDMLLVDRGFRDSKTWSDQRSFFEDFERHPDSFGFKKETTVSTGKLAIYYRQKT